MPPLARAQLALALLALDPGLGGLRLRARVGPVRDAVMASARSLPLPHRRLHPNMGADALDGGIDVSATLGAGTLTHTRGVLADPATLVLAMAERATPYLAARLAATLDSGGGHVLIALDEGIDGEALLPALSDRLAFEIDLEGCARGEIVAAPPCPTPVTLAEIQAPHALAEILVSVGVRLGITSLRALGFALRAAKAHAALHGRAEVIDEDIAVASALVLAHRATQMPGEEPPQDDPPPAEDRADPPEPPDSETVIPEDILLDAIKAVLPPELLATPGTSGSSRTATGSGAGQRKIGNRRGRPLPARDGGAGRVDIIATLRAAVPWQTLRQRDAPSRTGPIIRRSDLRYKRYIDLSDRVLIFTVDASGSAAMARMGEAKGAVELLLGEAYARRDHVALIAFRGSGAEVLLPPTRSLVQTKRKLADLPGGGATPLAAGLKQAHAIALAARRKGLTPTIVTLTDGRANMALDGTADRARAAQDARTIAQALHRDGIDSIVIDTGRRPAAALQQLADILAGVYIALPRADARSLSDAVTRSLDA